MISQTSEYALRAVVQLALCAPDPQTTQQIARATKVPLPYLSKVLQSLSRAGIVHSQRGLHGGCSLAKTPEELSVYEVIQAVDPWKRIDTCPLGLPQHGVHLCPLHKRIDDALATMEQAFRESTIAELLNEPTDSVPLCSELITAFRAAHQAPSPTPSSDSGAR